MLPERKQYKCLRGGVKRFHNVRELKGSHVGEPEGSHVCKFKGSRVGKSKGSHVCKFEGSRVGKSKGSNVGKFKGSIWGSQNVPTWGRQKVPIPPLPPMWEAKNGAYALKVHSIPIPLKTGRVCRP